MFETLQQNAAQWYAAGLTLAVVWLVVTVRPGLRRMVTLLLQARAPTWVESGTLLVQAIVLAGGLSLIVGWLGVNTIIAVCAVLLLWFVVASLWRGRGPTAALARMTPTPISAPSTRNSSALPTEVMSSVGDATSVANLAEPKVEPAIAALSSMPATEPALVLMTPAPTDLAPSPAVVTKGAPPQQAAALTRRPTLGKKTTTGLL